MRIEPNGLFFWIYFSIYYAPSLYTLTNTDELFLDSDVGLNYFMANSLFLITVYFSLLLNNFKRGKNLAIPLLSKPKNINHFTSSYNYNIKYLKLVLIPLNILMIIFFFVEGLPKIMLLGSNLNPQEFRFLGYDDRKLVLTFILEISRRGLYPLFFLFLLLYYNINKIKKPFLFHFTQITFFLISIINIDRGPIALIFFIYIYYFMIVKENVFLKKIIILFILLFSLSFTLAILTFLQYNIFEFDLGSIQDLSKSIILKRIVLDPSLAAYKYSFEIIRENNDFLYLKYSRLFSFITGNYVNSQSDISVYVAPVGIVGDLWRNFGFPGVFVFAIIISFGINYINKKIEYASYYKGHLVNLILVMFTITLIFGGLFSLQPIFLYFLILFILQLKKIKYE